MASGFSLKGKEIIMVTGKGGVGKSTIAASLALAGASSGLQTKLIELDLDSYFEKVFDLELNKDGVELIENLKLAKWSGMGCLQEYVDHLSKVRGLGKLFFDNPVMSRLLDIAPGLYELAILGKLSSKIRKHGPPDLSDLLVLDSYSTGHSMSMLRAPKVMSESISIGPMHEQSKGIVDVVKSDKMQIIIVLTPELMAFEESIELADSIKSEFGVSPLMVLNRCIKEFDELPAVDVPWENYLYEKQQEQDKVRKELQSMHYEFLECNLIAESLDPISLYQKVGEKWHL